MLSKGTCCTEQLDHPGMDSVKITEVKITRGKQRVRFLKRIPNSFIVDVPG